MMSEKQKNTISKLISSKRSTARKENVSNKISSHCENSAQTLSQIADAEIQKPTGYVKIIDEDKHIRIKINLNRLGSKTVHDILQNSKPATRDLIGAKESDAVYLYGAAHPSVQGDSCIQKTMTDNELKVAQNDAKTTKGKVSTTAQSACNKNNKLLSVSEQMRAMFGYSDNEVVIATFRYGNNNAELNDAHKQGPEQCRQKVYIPPFHYKKTSKRNKRNLCVSNTILVCNIPDVTEPKVAEGTVDPHIKSLVISVAPPLNKETPQRNRLSYKVQYRISISPKIYPFEFDKTNEVGSQLKIKPASSISPVTSKYDRIASCRESPLRNRPSDFLIPLSPIIGDRVYSGECESERTTSKQITLHRHESLIVTGVDKVAVNCETFVEKEMDVNTQKQRKRCSNEDTPCENKRKIISYHDLMTDDDDDDRIIMSRNKPIDTIEKYPSDASLCKRLNSDMTQNVKFSRNTLTKNMPWDFALRTSQTVMPVTADLDKVGVNKLSEKLTNEIIIIDDDEEDDVLETQNNFETSTSDHSDCAMITVSEANVIENDVGVIVKKECDTVSNENVLSMPDIEEDDIEILDVENIFADGEFLYPPPNDGSIWQRTMHETGEFIYENIPLVDTNGENANEESEDKQIENRLMYKGNQNEETPILDIIKSSDSDAETEKYVEDEEIARSDVELNVIDDDKITISEMKIELWDEENSLVIEEKPSFAYNEDNTVDFDIKSSPKIEKVEVVDERQTVDTDVQSNPEKEEISTEMHAESHLYNEEQTIKSECEMNNNNEVHDNPAEGTKSNSNSEDHIQNCSNELVNSSPNRNQDELNIHNLSNAITEIRRTSATTFEIYFNDSQQTTPPNHQPGVLRENVIEETNIDVLSYAQNKGGKITLLEDKIVHLNVSDVSPKKQGNIDCQSKSMVLQNTTEQTEDQSVTKNDHQPLTTVPQQQVTGETQQPVMKQIQQPDTREFPQLVTTQSQQRVIQEPPQLVPTKPQESLITVSQLPVTIANSGILQVVVNNQNTSTYPVPANATSVIIQNATENQMPRAPLQIAAVPVSNSHMSGYTQNYNEMHQMLNSQIPSISNVQATQRSETGQLYPLHLTGNNYGMGSQKNEEKSLQTPVPNHNLPIPYTAHNVQHQLNEPIAAGNHVETVKILSLNDTDIRVSQYNEKQVSHIPSQENNMVKQNIYPNPFSQHSNQTSMLPNNYPRAIEPARAAVTVNQHTGNTEAQMPYQGHNMISQYSNQHFGIPQNRQMSNNQTVQSGQHQPREYTSYNLPRNGMIAEQNNQTRIVPNHQPIPELTRYRPVHSQSEPMLSVSNNGRTMGANGINMNQNPSIQPVNNPHAVAQYRNVNNLPSRNSALQHNGAAINNNIHSYQPSVQNHPTHLPPPYQGHMQYSTQTLPKNNMELASTSLQLLHQNYVNTNIMYHQLIMEQQNQLKAMNMKIEELHVALQKKTNNPPRRGTKKNDNNYEAIPPVVQNSQQRFLENTGQQVMPIPPVPSENHDLTYRNHHARTDSQQVGLVPYIPSEEHRLAYRNYLARNNSQQMGPVPHVPSQENYLTYPNRPPGMDSQQVFPIPRVPPKEHYMQYRNRDVWKESQEVNSTPLVSPQESSLNYPNRSAEIESEQVHIVTLTRVEEQHLKYTNRSPAKNSQHVRPAPVSDFEKQYLKYINYRPVQQDTQERYPLTSDQPAGPAQNVIPAPAKNAYYPKSEALGSQNVSVVQPSVPLGSPSQSTSHHQPQRIHPVSIYNRPVRNEAAAKLLNLKTDKMHAQGELPDTNQSRNNDLFKIANLCNLDNNSTAQRNSAVNQLLSTENEPINLSVHDQNEINKPQQDNNVSDEATPNATSRKGNNQAGNEYIELEVWRKQLQKKQTLAPRNESRDSGYTGSPQEGAEKNFICKQCGGPSFFKCNQCLKTFYCSMECKNFLSKNDIAPCCRK